MKIKNTLFTTIMIGGMMVFGGCSQNDLNISAAMDALKAFTISDSQMRSMAMQSSRHMDRKNRVASKNSKYTKRLRRITRGLKLPNNRLRMNYKVYLTHDVNAFAMADGTVRVYSGLMDRMNDDQLRFVIGHEIGHVAYKHSKKAYKTALLTSAARKGVASRGGNVGRMAQGELGALSSKLVNAQFSQSEESQADSYGLKVLIVNKRNPMAAVGALNKLAKLGGSSSILSSHPSPEKRARDILAQIRR